MLKSRSIKVDVFADPKKLEKHMALLKKKEEANKQALLDLLAGKTLIDKEKELKGVTDQVTELLVKAKQDSAVADKIKAEANKYANDVRKSLQDDKDYIEQSKKYLNEFAKQLQEKENKLDLEAAELLSMRIDLGKELTSTKKLKEEYQTKLKNLKSTLAGI